MILTVSALCFKIRLKDGKQVLNHNCLFYNAVENHSVCFFFFSSSDSESSCTKSNV